MSDIEDSSQAIKKDVLDRATAHLASLPPHLRDRYSAQLILDLANEVDRLRGFLRAAYDQRDLLAVKVSQWEASYVFSSDERESIKEAVVALRSLLERTN